MLRAGLLFLLAVLAFAAPVQAKGLQKDARVFAVYVTAEWCPNCKILGPMLQQARIEGDLDTKDVLFVDLDLTDKTRIGQSIMLAQALGIGDYLRAQGSGTGYVALIDVRSKQEVARFDRDSSKEQIIAGVMAALAAAQAAP